MKDNPRIPIIILIIGLMLAMFVAGAKHSINNFQKTLVVRGLAEYNSTNGIWQWKK